jgi:membrane-bound metal-dependent hydrolase YbcI (DUF457 family)
VIFWHLGITLLIVRYVFRDPNMDLRWVLVGSLLPDVIDKPIGSIFFHDTFGTHRLFAHALVFPVALLAVVMVVTRRGTASRRGAIAVVIGCFVHLLLDGVWISPETFLWPFFGLEFPRVAGSEFGSLVRNMLASPMVWLGEALGVAYLAYLWRRHLGASGDVKRFAGDGRLALRRS